MNRHQGQLVPADGVLEPATLPVAQDLTVADEAAVFMREHPQVLNDLAVIVTGYAAHPSCTRVPARLGWEQLRHNYRLAGVGVSLPNNYQRHVYARLIEARPDLAPYFPKTTAA